MPSFRFENTNEAAQVNAKLIAAANYDLNHAIGAQPNSTVSYGSEFCPVSVLEPLLQYHEDWGRASNILTNGSDSDIQPIDDDIRLQDLHANMAFGNHKSASTEQAIETLKKHHGKEVTHGWMLPIPIPFVPMIKDSSVCPLGVATQWTVTECGERVRKYRTTHNCSYEGPSGHSINNRFIRELLSPNIYGQALRRFLHCIAEMRFHYPNHEILLGKYDGDAAFRRLHVNGRLAVASITIFMQLAYILLRLPFGSVPAPSEWCIFSEILVDLANDLLEDKTWEPEELHSPHRKLFKEPEFEEDGIPFGQAHELHVDVPLRLSVAEGFMDDLFTAVLNDTNRNERSCNAIPLLMHILFRPVAKDEPITREDVLSIRKLLGEGTMAEQKIILGWLLNTRLFRVFLPDDKAKAWTEEIMGILSHTKVQEKELESIIGKLNHLAYLSPCGRYFLNRLRHLLTLCKKYGAQRLAIWHRDDLKLHLEFIQAANTRGTSINNIIYVKHNVTVISDACPFGIGGFNDLGLAWRWKIPTELVGVFTLNLLEFLASAISIHLTLLQNPDKQLHILAFTDSSSALGWLYKSSFNPITQPLHDEVARWLASRIIASDSSLYSQHIRGVYNIIADALSRDFHITDDWLTTLLYFYYPEQMPANFKIQNLNKEVVSWIWSLSHRATMKKECQEKHTKSSMGALIDGAVFARMSEFMMNGSLTSVDQNVLSSCLPLLPVSGETYMARENWTNSLLAQSKPPSTMWLRPLGQTFGAPRFSTTTDAPPSSSNAKSKDTKMRTQV